MSRTLLLADGSITIQRVVELTFAHEDIRVTSVGDGRRAIQILEAEQPDVVLLDVDLPEVDGYAVAAHIRRVPRLKNVAVLLLAGAFEPVDQEKARDVGSDGVIIKPFEPQVVVTRVKELMDQRERQAAAPPPRTTELPATQSVSAGPRQAPAAAAPAPEPTQAEKGKPEPAFLRMAPREQSKPAEDAPVLESLELPTRPMWETPASSVSAPVSFPSIPLNPPAPAPAPVLPPPPKVTLASAFTALLAAEQSAQPASAPVVALSEASVEDAVRRVLVRMTDDLVRRIVLDTAERLIREEIEKIKANPD
jgi:CheY-like chemotaxis protein